MKKWVGSPILPARWVFLMESPPWLSLPVQKTAEIRRLSSRNNSRFLVRLLQLSRNLRRSRGEVRCRIIGSGLGLWDGSPELSGIVEVSPTGLKNGLP